MTLLQKTWHQPYNSHAVPDVRTDAARQYQFAHWMIKRALTEIPVNPWTVLASSNTVTVGLGDHWNDRTDIVTGTNDTWPGSWCVLKSPDTHPKGPIYLVMKATVGGGGVWYYPTYRIAVSCPDLSTGSLYRVPEATGPEISKGVQFNSPISGSFEWYFTALVAEDGSFFIIWTTLEVQDNSFLAFNWLKGAHNLDPYPFVFWGSEGGAGSPGTFFYTSDGNFWQDAYTIAPDGTQVQCALSPPAQRYGDYEYIMTSRTADDVNRSGKPFSWPIRVFNITSGYRGHKGFMEDLWWAGDGGVANNERYPKRWGQAGYVGENMEVMQRGCLWFPCKVPFRW